MTSSGLADPSTHATSTDPRWVAGRWVTADQVWLELPDPAARGAQVWSPRWQAPGAPLATGVALTAGAHLLGSRAAEAVPSGVVIYGWSAPDVLDARWAHALLARDQPGRGSAQRAPQAAPDGFAGQFEIQYWTHDGKPAGGPLELTIRRAGADYRLSWFAAGPHPVKLSGFGIELDERLFAVWGAEHDAPVIALSLLDVPAAPASRLHERTLTEAGQSRETTYSR